MSTYSAGEDNARTVSVQLTYHARFQNALHSRNCLISPPVIALYSPNNFISVIDPETKTLRAYSVTLNLIKQILIAKLQIHHGAWELTQNVWVVRYVRVCINGYYAEVIKFVWCCIFYPCNPRCCCRPFISSGLVRVLYFLNASVQPLTR